jgi:hypothetical protein
MLERLVPEKIHALLGQVELDLPRRRCGLPRRPQERGVPLRHLGRLLDVEIALLDEALHDRVEQLAQLALQVAVPLRVTGRVAPEELHHVGRELARFHQGAEDRVPEPVERAVPAFARLGPPGPVARPAGKTGLEQEVAQLVQQRLEIDGVGEAGDVLCIRGVAHSASELREQ